MVDNNSTDDTKAVCAAFAADAPLPVRYLFEPKRGKSNALNCGLAEAKGDVMYFTDDDCVFSEGFADALAREFADDAELDGIGGRVELYDPADLPLATRLMDTRIELKDSSQLFFLLPGCNMAFRRRVFDRIGGFDPLFGPGTPRVVEDADFIYRAFKAGFRLVYFPTILIYHGHGRRSAADAQKTRRDYVIGRGAFYAKHLLGRDNTVLRISYWEMVGLFRSMARQAIGGRIDREAIAVALLLIRGAGSYLRARLA